MRMIGFLPRQPLVRVQVQVQVCWGAARASCFENISESKDSEEFSLPFFADGECCLLSHEHRQTDRQTGLVDIVELRALPKVNEVHIMKWGRLRAGLSH